LKTVSFVPLVVSLIVVESRFIDCRGIVGVKNVSESIFEKIRPPGRYIVVGVGRGNSGEPVIEYNVKLR
jgi:hypothetical protein